MTVIELLFDGVLALSLLALAGGSLYARTLYASVVLFIAFGLLLAITWARLGSADLALAEAAIGAGLTGVLLFSALSQVGQKEIQGPTWHWQRDWAALGFVALTFILLVRAVWPLAEYHAPLPELVQIHLTDSGVSHPVTAVLLNFRSWDTLLELAVLLLALTGLKQLILPQTQPTPPWRLLASWGRVLAPLTVLVGGYLLWRGSSAPGGAFQSGALLAAGAVMLRLNQLLPPLRWSHWLVRSLVLIGLLVFLGVAAATAWLGNGWLDLPAGWSGPLIIVIEVAATLSIAATLTLLVVGEKEELHP